MKYMFNLYHFSNKKNLLVFIVILLTGFLLRAIGADWGFPYFFHPDENHIPFSSYSLFANHSLDPHFYSWPSHLSIYLNSLLYSVFSYLVFHKSIVLTFAEHKFTYFEYSRIVTALFRNFHDCNKLLNWQRIQCENRIILCFDSLYFSPLCRTFPLYYP